MVAGENISIYPEWTGISIQAMPHSLSGGAFRRVCAAPVDMQLPSARGSWFGVIWTHLHYGPWE